MSKIDKLSILGVRSFDNTRSETIQFYSPLTLVVGYNGSGKTTIIECLKYATTGLLPPNSKGGAFIHDPKLAGEREVLAQVKLSFKAATGARMVTTRSLQLTVKKLTRQQKTLEGQLLMVKDGERTAISSRVAELDQIIPQYLGVSTAVLDNVIFCHQDESLWPMSEPSVLKKKFDEIFEAQKYTKAIENIKQLRKKQNEELGKFKIIEQHAKEDKSNGEKTEKRMMKLQDELEILREEFGRLGEKMEQAKQLAHEAAQRYNTFDAVARSLETEKKSAEDTKALLDSLSSTMKKVDKSDEWLTDTLEQFDSLIEEYEQDKDSRLVEFQRTKNQLEAHQAEKGNMLARRGRAEAEKTQYEKQLQGRGDLVKTVARQYSLRGFDAVSNQPLFDNFMQQIKKISREHTNDLSRAREDADRKRKEAQGDVNRLDQRQRALQDSKRESKKLLTQNDREVQHKRKLVSQISEDEGSKAVIESAIEDNTTRLEKVETDARTQSRDKALSEADSKITQLEDMAKRLREELIQSTRRSDEMAELSHLKKLAKDGERSLETMKSVHGEKIKGALGTDLSPATVESDYQVMFDNRSRDLASAEQARNTASRLVEQSDFKARTVADEIKKKEKIEKDAEKKVRNAIGDNPSEYENVLQESQDRLDQLRDDAGQAAGMASFMKDVLEMAEKKKACRTCARTFRNDAELAGFKKRIASSLARDNVAAQEEQVQEYEKELQAIRDVTIDHEMWKQVQSELPNLKEDERKAIAERDQLVTRLEQRDRELEERQEAKKELEALFRTVQSISKHAAEIKTSETKIQQLSQRQSQAEKFRTLDDIQEEMTDVEKRTREARQIAQRLTKEGETQQNEISRLRLELSRLHGELSTCTYQLEKKASLEAELEKIKAATAKQRDTMANADSEIGKLDSEIATANAKYENIDQNNKSTEKDLRSRVDQVSSQLQDLNYLDKMVQDYIAAGGLEELDRVERTLQSKAEEIGRLETAQGDQTREINRLKEQVDQSEAVRRNYSDNLQHRSMTRKYESTLKEVAQLTEKVSGEDPERYKRESKRRDDEKHLYSGQREGKMGEMKVKDNQLAELLGDYEDQYKDAARKYKESHIRTETCKAAVEDLARYGAALDRAIMTYHALKMEEINRIIEELWQGTYQGTDIDTIVIRSDNENAKGNRNYNYRVSMVKQDAEMDMRGRCSAGQKVLASIIIRLALAECFGVNCGLIALDEPTTNLDRDNIRSLAESLHGIIRHRMTQSNFQLIVITHDEEFLRHMQCGDFSDYYYRVSRSERQKSIIERQDIADVL